MKSKCRTMAAVVDAADALVSIAAHDSNDTTAVTNAACALELVVHDYREVVKRIEEEEGEDAIQ